MAVTVLSPWPGTTATVTRGAALACLKASITGGASLSDDRGHALGEAAAVMVERFAPSAPQPVKNEAVLRLAGWLLARAPRPVQSIQTGGLRMDFRERFSAPSAMVNSGARSLLLPWRARRALPVSEDAEPQRATPEPEPGEGITREELDRILEERLRNVITWGG